MTKRAGNSEIPLELKWGWQSFRDKGLSRSENREPRGAVQSQHKERTLREEPCFYGENECQRVAATVQTGNTCRGLLVSWGPPLLL